MAITKGEWERAQKDKKIKIKYHKPNSNSDEATSSFADGLNVNYR